MPTIRGTFSATCFVAITALPPRAFGQLPNSCTSTLYDVPDAISTQINSINVRGDITGAYTPADSVSHAFVRLGTSPGIITFASPDGKAASTPVFNAEGQIAFTVGTPSVPALSTRIMINGIPAPLLYASASQVSAVVPYEVTGNSASVKVEFQDNDHCPSSYPLLHRHRAFSPWTDQRLVRVSSSIRTVAINTVLNPAKRGDIIVIYATGFGQTAPSE